MDNNHSLHLQCYHQRLELKHRNCSKSAFLSLAYGSLSQLQTKRLGFLHPRETEYYDSLRFTKRQHSYLLGHYCAKKALKQYYPHLETKSILLKKGVLEQPLIDAPIHLKTHITLSHAEPLAAAIAYPEEYSIGIDIECIKSSIAQVMEDQLTAKEKETIQIHPVYPPETKYTLYWTAKEAISKALRTGMTVPFTLFALKNLRWHSNYWIAEFEHFAQYQVISFLVGDHYVCSIVYPKESTIILNTVAIYQALTANPVSNPS